MLTKYFWKSGWFSLKINWEWEAKMKRSILSISLSKKRFSSDHKIQLSGSFCYFVFQMTWVSCKLEKKHASILIGGTVNHVNHLVKASLFNFIIFVKSTLLNKKVFSLLSCLIFCFFFFPVCFCADTQPTLHQLKQQEDIRTELPHRMAEV